MLDDRAARSCAAALGVSTRGTLGVLLLAEPLRRGLPCPSPAHHSRRPFRSHLSLHSGQCPQSAAPTLPLLRLPTRRHQLQDHSRLRLRSYLPSPGRQRVRSPRHYSHRGPPLRRLRLCQLLQSRRRYPLSRRRYPQSRRRCQPWASPPHHTKLIGPVVRCTMQVGKVPVPVIAAVCRALHSGPGAQLPLASVQGVIPLPARLILTSTARFTPPPCPCVPVVP